MNYVLFNFMQSLTTLPSGRFAVRFQLWAETCSSITSRTAKGPVSILSDGCRNFFYSGFTADLDPVSMWMRGAVPPVIRTSSRSLSSTAIALPTHSVQQQRRAVCRNSMPRNWVPLPFFSLPQRGKSWNETWSGDERRYIKRRNLQKAVNEMLWHLNLLQHEIRENNTSY